MRKRLDIKKGAVYGELTVIRETTDRTGKWKPRTFLCKCSCGKTKDVDMSRMIRGKTRSCGHLQELELKRKKLAGWNTINYRTNLCDIL